MSPKQRLSELQTLILKSKSIKNNQKAILRLLTINDRIHNLETKINQMEHERSCIHTNQSTGSV